jgi:hypothetical protein
MAREKDNRHVTAFGSRLLLEFETIQIRKRHITDETARNGGRARVRNSCAWAPAANQRCGSATRPDSYQGSDQYPRPIHLFLQLWLNRECYTV